MGNIQLIIILTIICIIIYLKKNRESNILNSSKSKFLRNKIISLESPWNIRDSKGKKLQNMNTIDDLFTDFY